VTLSHGWCPRPQFSAIASLHIVIHHEYPPPPQHHRMSRPLPAEQHLYTRGSVQRYSHRRVAAHACGTLRRLEELSTAPKTWKCRLLSLHDLRAVQRRTGVLGRGCCFLRSEGSQLPVSDTAPVFGGVVLPGVRGRRAISPVFCRRLVVRSPSPAAVSKESRLLCQKPGREGILLTAGESLW
jgi:hypothetical protein